MAKKWNIKNLELNLEAALERPWLLFPQKYRDMQIAKTYPLPDSMEDLQALLRIPVTFAPGEKNNATITYLRRVRNEATRRHRFRAGIAIEKVAAQTEESSRALDRQVEEASRAMEEVVQKVKDRADQAIASLDSIFRLGLEGLQGQMQAHLGEQDWKGERITASAFRECTRMAIQGVKGLGLPSPEVDKAREVVVREVAASIKATREAMSEEVVGGDEEKLH